MYVISQSQQNAMYSQQSLNSGFASNKPDQGLYCPYNETMSLLQLIDVESGLWFESLLGRHIILMVLQSMGSNYCTISYCVLSVYRVAMNKQAYWGCQL